MDGAKVVRQRNVEIGRLTDDGLRVIQSKLPASSDDTPEKWKVLVDNLQRARLNYPIDPQEPAAAKPAS
jgi:hypothetical protein